ncbi:outer membrane beta-barrel protein [Flavitalea flava]
MANSVKLTPGRKSSKNYLLLFILIFLSSLVIYGQKKDPLPKIDVLDSVIVTPGHIPIHIKRDTLEYTTGNVRLKAGANVEELLRLLPGLRIDEHGSLTLNGEKIERILIEGEDIFGRDLTRVTRNFNGDAIARVEVFNKLSTKAEFTGIRDGKTTKTINLILKEDRKNESFLKAEAGTGGQGYYDARAIGVALKGKRQLTAFGSASNIGSTGFKGEEGDGDLQGFDNPGTENGGLDVSAGTGIPRLIGGALHYADSWVRNHAAGNYEYGHLTTHPFSSAIIQQTLPGKVYRQEQSAYSDNNQDRHNLSMAINLYPDSSNAFGFWASGKRVTGNNQYNNVGKGYFNDTLINSSLRNIQSAINNQDFRSHFGWRRKSRRSKRVFSLLTDITRQDNLADGYLKAINNFYPSGIGLPSQDTVDQRKAISGNTMIVNANANYSEPLWKDAVFILSYEFGLNHSVVAQDSYNRDDGKYQAKVDSLSSQYAYHIITHKAGFGIQSYSHKQFNYWAGADILDYVYRQRDQVKNNLFRYKSLHLIPRVGLQYFTKSKILSFSYIGLVQQPAANQLQVIQNNTDPLHVIIGNPGLQPATSHDFSLNLTSPKSLFTGLLLNYGFTTNSICDRIGIDSLGRELSQAVNSRGSNKARIRLTGHKSLERLKLDIDFSTNLLYYPTFTLVNEELSRNESYNLGGDIGLRKYVAGKFAFSLTAGATWFYSRSSINSLAITRYWVQHHAIQFSFFPITGLEIGTNINYTWRQKTDLFPLHNQTLFCDAWLQKTFLDNRLNLRGQIHDILGQSIGINRAISTNQVSENRYNVLGRYWQVTAGYRFMGKTKRE